VDACAGDVVSSDRGEAASGSDGEFFAVVQDAEVGALDNDRDEFAGVAWRGPTLIRWRATKIRPVVWTLRLA